MHVPIPSTPPTSQPPDGWNGHWCVSVWAVVPTICIACELDCSALSGDCRQLDEMHSLRFDAVVTPEVQFISSSKKVIHKALLNNALFVLASAFR
jgi:hypothetical protein